MNRTRTPLRTAGTRVARLGPRPRASRSRVPPQRLTSVNMRGVEEYALSGLVRTNTVIRRTDQVCGDATHRACRQDQSSAGGPSHPTIATAARPASPAGTRTTPAGLKPEVALVDHNRMTETSECPDGDQAEPRPSQRRPSIWRASTPILTPTGWRTASDLSVGDSLLGAHGGRLTVDSVELAARPSAVPGGFQRWCLGPRRARSGVANADAQRPGVRQARRSITVAHCRRPIELGELLASGEATARLRTDGGLHRVRHVPSDLPLDPYGLGLLLGDGSFRPGTPTFTKPEPQLHQALARAFPNNRQTVLGDPAKGGDLAPGRRGANELTLALREIGLWGKNSAEKFVPAPYLAGVTGAASGARSRVSWTPTAGWNGTPWATAAHTSAPQADCLAEDVVELVESLGGTTTVQPSSQAAPPGRRRTTRLDDSSAAAPGPTSPSG